jgi:D-beta-D-heptose 7-phosphate kinase/D-beta-D-heptose 1-phosphate adenosyltransferase
MDLLSILKNFKQRRILVIGDLILDRYIWGKVSRISPEAPVPVVEVMDDTFVLGGAANVANNIVSLGGQVTVSGIVGRDRAAEMLEKLFGEKGIEFFAIEDKRPTTIKTRVIAHSQQVVRFDREDKEKLSGRALKSLLTYIEEAVPEHDVIVVSDYKKGVVSAHVMKAVLKASRGRKFVVVDPKIGHFHLYKGVSMITPNLMEAAHGAGVEITDEKTLVKAGTKLLKKLGCEAVLLTRGEQGMSLFQKTGVIHIPTFARKVYDVTGAGDTVIATFALAYASGATLEESAILANYAAGIVVGEVGTAVTTQAKLKQALKNSKKIG